MFFYYYMFECVEIETKICSSVKQNIDRYPNGHITELIQKQNPRVKK